MNARIIGYFILISVLIACQSSQKEQLAQDYYQALDESDFTGIVRLQLDSVRVKEGQYTSVYSVGDYVNWFQWDSVFQPSYKILDMRTTEEGIEIKVSKDDPRIQFLNERPLVTKEQLQIKAGKIYSLEVLEYISFNNEQWDANREKLVSWVDKNHPELNGFINDQTLKGGLDYLKALDLYAQRNPN